MTRDQVRKSIDRLKIAVVDSGPHGISIRRCGAVVSNGHRLVRSETGIGAVWHEEIWRIYSGSGIAGNSGSFWISKKGSNIAEHLGPFTAIRTLEQALRAWRRWDLP